MVTLQPLTVEEFPAFFDQAVAFYAEQNVAAGRFAASDAAELSRVETLRLLPEGIATAGHFIFAICAETEEQPVGHLWLASMPRGGSRVMFVCQVGIKPGFRRQGYARDALRAAEAFAREHGLNGMGLHVFAHNTAAQALYRSLGYNVASVNMFKPLDAGDA